MKNRKFEVHQFDSHREANEFWNKMRKVYKDVIEPRPVYDINERGSAYVMYEVTVYVDKERET